MTDDDLQVLLDFRADTPEPDAKTTRRIYALATGRRPRRRGLALRVALVAVAAAAIALGVFSALPGDGPSVVARAAAALDPAGDTILHTVVVTTTRRPDGSTATHRSETWQQSSPPYDSRRVEGDGRRWREHASANGRPQVYIGHTNTLYTLPPDTVVPPGMRWVDATETGLVTRMRRLLHSGGAHEDGRLTVGGRDAIRIVSSSSTLMLVVDAETFEPIEWRTVSDEGIVETSRFETYELLPENHASLALLSIAAQHPRATVEPSMTLEDLGVSAR